MDEVKELRTYNAKFFKGGRAHLHAGHIHYENKLGVGDGKVGWRTIDWTLQWDSTRRGWHFQYHSFHPFLPEYADGWIEFRDLYEAKDQIIRWRAAANHIKGRVISNIDGLSAGANAVVYDNAFGNGIDLILCFTRSTFRRIVRIRAGHYPAQDSSFDFEIELPFGKRVYRGYDAKTPAYELDVTKDKEFDTNKQTFIGIEQNDGKEWFTYLRPFQIWDSNEEVKREIAKVNFVLSDGKTYLRKNIPLSFFANAQGDVYTDDTVSYYAGAGDGRVGNEGSDTWDNIHDAATGSAASHTSSTELVQSSDDGAGYITIRRTYFPVDTSALPDDATITGASMFVYHYASGTNTDNDGDDWVGLVQTFQASNTALATADFEDCGSDDPQQGGQAYAVPVEGSDTRHDITDLIATAQYYEWPLNATGLGWISKTGYTKLGFREGHDALDSPVAVGGSNRSRFYLSEQTGTSEDPYLEVTYSVTHALSGQIDAQSTVTGVLAVKRSVSGIIAGQSSVSGALLAKRSLQGQITAQSSVSGSLTCKRGLAGQIAAVSTVTGSLSVKKSLSGTITAVSTITGTLRTLVVPLSGTIAAQSGVSGSLSRTRGLSGLIAATTQVTGSLTLTLSLSGTVTCESTVAGLLGLTKPFAGVIACQSTVGGTLRIIIPLSGTIAAVSTVDGSMVRTLALQGSVDAVSNVLGSLTMQWALQGSISATSAVSGTLVEAALVGVMVGSNVGSLNSILQRT